MTTEVPGLAEALRRPGIKVDAELRLTDGARLATIVVLSDAIGTLAMKALVRAVRTERRDAEDLWRCLEIAAAEDVNPSDFDETATLRDLRLVPRPTDCSLSRWQRRRRVALPHWQQGPAIGGVVPSPGMARRTVLGRCSPTHERQPTQSTCPASSLRSTTSPRAPRR